MESLNEVFTNWYPVLFLISAGIALALWAASTLIVAMNARLVKLDK